MLTVLHEHLKVVFFIHIICLKNCPALNNLRVFLKNQLLYFYSYYNTNAHIRNVIKIPI